MTKATYRRKKILRFIVPNRLMMVEWRHGDRNDLTSSITSRKQRECTGYSISFLILKACPQWCTFSSKATSPMSCQTVPLSEDWVFKCLKLWWIFTNYHNTEAKYSFFPQSFKGPHSRYHHHFWGLLDGYSSLSTWWDLESPRRCTLMHVCGGVSRDV